MISIRFFLFEPSLILDLFVYVSALFVIINYHHDTDDNGSEGKQTK